MALLIINFIIFILTFLSDMLVTFLTRQQRVIKRSKSAVKLNSDYISLNLNKSLAAFSRESSLVSALG